MQVINNRVVQTYTPRELAFSVANPRTDLEGWHYGLSEQELLIRTVTRHLWAEAWNENAFSQGSTAKGIINIKGNMTQQALEQFRSQWLAQISSVTNAWKTPIINSRDEMQSISLQPTNQEMGYAQWMEDLTKTACAIFLVDPAENQSRHAHHGRHTAAVHDHQRGAAEAEPRPWPAAIAAPDR